MELQWQQLYKLKQLKTNVMKLNNINKYYSFTGIGTSETPWQW